MRKSEKNTIPNIWTARENLLHLYQVLAAGLGVLAVSMLIVTLVMCFRDPIVVMRSVSGQEFYPSERARAGVEKSDVEAFSKRFLEALYVWQVFDAQALAKEVGPYAEEALVSKIVDTQVQKYGRDFKGKKISQAITFVRVAVKEDRVTCSFDRVLKIEGIPLVIPMEVTLSMIQGGATRLNPMGVYVSGILEREGAD